MAVFGGSMNTTGAGLPTRRTGGLGAAPKPDNLTGAYNIANTATEQQAGDYGNIMNEYKKLLSGTGSVQPYQASGARAPAIANLAELAKTGGYSPEALADLRSRAISPIRSMYAGATRDIDRQRALQGGFSPNYAAVRAKMAREMSDSIANQMTNVNAGIAERVAGGRMQAASPYASITSQQAGAEDEASQFNRQIVPQQQQNILQGMTSLYGTTPALVNTFGNQALNAAQLQNQINQQNTQSRNQLFDSMVRGLG